MKSVSKLFLSLSLATAAVSASAAVINFDNLVGGRLGLGTVVTNQYVASLGVTFSDSSAGGAHAENFLGSLIPGSTSPNVLWADQGSGGSSGEYLQISFANAVAGVSALFGTSLGANITMQAFRGASLVDSITLTGATITGDVRSGTISLGDSGITSVRLSSLSGNSSFNFSIDNLTFEAAAAVPEPETYALMLAGLAMVGMAARRRLQAGTA